MVELITFVSASSVALTDRYLGSVELSIMGFKSSISEYKLVVMSNNSLSSPERNNSGKPLSWKCFRHELSRMLVLTLDNAKRMLDCSPQTQSLFNVVTV